MSRCLRPTCSRCFAVTRFGVTVVRGEQFVGMVTVDDLLIGMAGALADLARPVIAEVVFGGHHDAAVPAIA